MKHNEIFSKIISEYDKKDIDRLSREAFKSASVESNSLSDSTANFSDQDWDILEQISEKIWFLDVSIDVKFDIGFKFFEKFPIYSLALNPFYEAFRDGLFSKVLCETLWSKFYYYLKAIREYRIPTEYILWVEFFEDPDTVSESWVGLSNISSINNDLILILKLSGPVPWEEKVDIFYQCLNDDENHIEILNAILLSMTEVYGKYNLKEAKKIIGKLNLDKSKPEYKKWNRVLSKMKL